MNSLSQRSLLLLALLIVLMLCCLCLVFSGLPWSLNRISKDPKEISALGDAEESIQLAIAAQIESEPIFMMFDTDINNLTISEDRTWATAELIPTDPDTGEVIPTEPGLALATWNEEWQQWHTFLPSDEGWIEALQAAPETLISAEERAAWLEIATEQELLVPDAPLSGYFLPWAYGETMRVTQSVGHDRYTPSGNAHFSFDFATPGYPSRQFKVYAVRDAIVKYAVWRHRDGSEGSAQTNYLLLEDRSTNPTTYHLYMHFAQDSIPEDLRTPGAYVRRGQFIGIADDTGISSGNHLHFQVHTNPVSYWGRAVDILFNDVKINGGRPRISSDQRYCKSSDICAQVQNDYVSLNRLMYIYVPFAARNLRP